MEIVGFIVAIVYVIVSYRMLKYTIYRNSAVIFSDPMALFVKKLCLAVCLGFIVIPWGIIVLIKERRR